VIDKSLSSEKIPHLKRKEGTGIKFKFSKPSSMALPPFNFIKTFRNWFKNY
jgi:hypothetical protein